MEGCGKMFIVFYRGLFMHGSRGVGTGDPDHPSCIEKHKAVDYLRISGWTSTKLPISGSHPTAREAPFMTFRWRANGGWFW